eukprot:9850454-Karenia_brevis.AAC.1
MAASKFLSALAECLACQRRMQMPPAHTLKPTLVGLLLGLHFRGTDGLKHDSCWEQHYHNILMTLGWKKGRGWECLYKHPTTG